MGRCRLCKQEGHNRKKCPTKMVKISSLELDLETGEITECELLRTADTIQHVYEEVAPKIRDASSILMEFDLSVLVERYTKICTECSCVVYYPKMVGEQVMCCDCYYKRLDNCSVCGCAIKYIYKWKGSVVCGPCYITVHEKLSDDVNEYIRHRGLTKCSFCDKERRRIYGFHLDHLNMFDKNESVISMISRGDAIDDIKAEVDKCQLLCVDCHMLVTGAERDCKFIQAKSKKINERELYDAVMPTIYEKIRAFRGGGGGGRGEGYSPGDLPS